MARGRWIHWTSALTMLIAAACGDDDGDELPELARIAADVRELEFLEPVDVVVMTRAEFSAQAAANADAIDDAELAEFAATWGRLGFFPIDADLRPIVASSSSDWVGASYSTETKSITLVEAGDSVQVHEYVHALQDQHFDLMAYEGTTSDSYLARRAVTEGDAVLAEYRFILGDDYGVGLENGNWPDLIAGGRSDSASYLASAQYPVFFLDYPSFVYSYGLEYTADNLIGVSVDDPPDPPPYDWSREDELFTERLPVSTQQVLRRDVDLDPVEGVGLDHVPSDLADRLESIDWDTLGEWYIYLLLYALDGSDALPDARELAAGWDGDRVLFVRDLAGDATATVWASAWDDEATATQALAALAALYDSEAVAEGPPELGRAGDGEPVWLEQRGNRVVAVKNLDPELAPALADAAFRPPQAPRARRVRPPLGKRRELIDRATGARPHPGRAAAPR